MSESDLQGSRESQTFRRAEPTQTDAADPAERYQQMYCAACSAGPDGQLRLDTERFAQGLAEAGMGALTQQELYHLALLAAAEGEPALPADDVRAVLMKAS